jgi:hypothetical protein
MSSSPSDETGRGVGHARGGPILDEALVDGNPSAAGWWIDVSAAATAPARIMLPLDIYGNMRPP